jgi:hypothetical protein
MLYYSRFPPFDEKSTQTTAGMFTWQQKGSQYLKCSDFRNIRKDDGESPEVCRAIITQV